MVFSYFFRIFIMKCFQMIHKGCIGRKQNETVAWQERERAYLEDLCAGRGIEIETLGVKRENLSLLEYKAAMREADAETKAVKSAAVLVSSLFGGEEYVKVKKADWNRIVTVFHKAVRQNHLVEKYEKKTARLEKRIDALNGRLDKLKRFVESGGLGEAFAEYLKSLAPKTIKQKLKEAKAEAAEQNWQRTDNIRRMPEKEKYQGQEL